MHTELHPRPHNIIPGRITIELWHEGQFIGTVTSFPDGPGIQLSSKYLDDVVISKLPANSLVPVPGLLIRLPHKPTQN